MLGVLGGAFKFKVEEILEGCLDSFPSPSPSVKIQIMSGTEVYRRKIAGRCQQTLKKVC